MSLQELAYALELEAEQFQAERAKEIEYELRYAIPVSIAEYECYRKHLTEGVYEEGEPWSSQGQ